MLHITIIDKHGAAQHVQAADDCLVGSDGGEGNVALKSWRVSGQHARLLRTPNGPLLQCLASLGGVTVNGARVDGQYGPLAPTDVIGIGPFRLQVADQAGGGAPAAPAGVATQAIVAAAPLAAAAPGPMPGAAHAPALASASPVDACATPARSPSSAPGYLAPGLAQDPAPGAMGQPPGLLPGLPPGRLLVPVPEAGVRALEFEWRQKLHNRLLQTIDLRRKDVSKMSDAQLRTETAQVIDQLVADEDVPATLDRASLARQVLNEAVGLGPLEELLADPEVDEIMINRFERIYVERGGRLERHALTFTSDRAVLGVIERIVAPLGRRIDESSPMVDARLPDGSRVNAVIPPLALKGPCLTIRKFIQERKSAADLVSMGSISAAMATFLELCVLSRKNIVVSGGTGSGKTTLLNILSNFIPDGERIVTIEDAAELKLHHDHWIALEARPANVEGKGAITIRELARNALRMRPDRIVVGECRGGEAVDMLQAMNTGHDGSLTTFHANTPRDALARLETMVLMAGIDLPVSAIRDQAASAIQIIVQQTRFACGSRKVTSITELTGMESGKYQLQELFRFVPLGYASAQAGGKVRGYFTGCNMIPSFYEALRAQGMAPDLAIFTPEAAPGAAGDGP